MVEHPLLKIILQCTYTCTGLMTRPVGAEVFIGEALVTVQTPWEKNGAYCIRKII